MNAGHTPGPWDVTGCKFPDDDMGGVYYRVQAEGIDASAANARLIAAAPELLEALEVLADALANPVRPGHIAYRSKADLIGRAERAIAKATGQ